MEVLKEAESSSNDIMVDNSNDSFDFFKFLDFDTSLQTEEQPTYLIDSNSSIIFDENVQLPNVVTEPSFSEDIINAQIVDSNGFYSITPSVTCTPIEPSKKTSNYYLSEDTILCKRDGFVSFKAEAPVGSIMHVEFRTEHDGSDVMACSKHKASSPYAFQLKAPRATVPYLGHNQFMFEKQFEDFQVKSLCFNSCSKQKNLEFFLIFKILTPQGVQLLEKKFKMFVRGGYKRDRKIFIERGSISYTGDAQSLVDVPTLAFTMKSMADHEKVVKLIKELDGTPFPFAIKTEQPPAKIRKVGVGDVKGQ